MRFKLNLILFLWAISVVLTPIYVFSEGMPQPSDFCIAGVAVLIFAKIVLEGHLYIDARLSPALRALGAFFLYTIIVNLTWAIYLDSSGMLKSALNYSYLFLLFFAVIYLYQQYGRIVLIITIHAMALAILYEAAYTWSSGANLSTLVGSRPKGSFNNPNQLGYFAVLGASIVYLGSLLIERSKKFLVYQWVLYLATLYITLASLSRAAALAMVVLGLLLAVKRSIAVAIVLGLLTLFVTSSGLLEEIQRSRLVVVDEQDVDANRGYDRLYLYPQHLVLGSGEGEYSRFPSGVGGHEIHSTPATLLFSYGIVGTFFFVLFLIRIYQQAGFSIVLFMLPLFTYSLTHNGLRFRPFWIFLALILCVGIELTKEAREKRILRMRSGMAYQDREAAVPA